MSSPLSTSSLSLFVPPVTNKRFFYAMTRALTIWPLDSDWFRLETLDDSLQPTIDMLLNLSIFMYFGAVCPWPLFLNQPKPPITITSDPIIPLYRLVPLGILILMFRRLPVVYAMHRKIRQIEEKQQALFVGYFGPIGVSAVFYLYVSKQFLAEITTAGIEGEETIRGDAARLSDTMEVIIWFLAICSIVCFWSRTSEDIMLTMKQVVHGLSVPLGKLGYHLPRTISNAIDSQSRDIEEPAPFHVRRHITDGGQYVRQGKAPRSMAKTPAPGDTPPRPIFRLGGTPMKTGSEGQDDSEALQELSRTAPGMDSPDRTQGASERMEGATELARLKAVAREESR